MKKLTFLLAASLMTMAMATSCNDDVVYPFGNDEQVERNVISDPQNQFQNDVIKSKFLIPATAMLADNDGISQAIRSRIVNQIDEAEQAEIIFIDNNWKLSDQHVDAILRSYLKGGIIVLCGKDKEGLISFRDRLLNCGCTPQEGLPPLLTENQVRTLNSIFNDGQMINTREDKAFDCIAFSLDGIYCIDFKYDFEGKASEAEYAYSNPDKADAEQQVVESRSYVVNTEDVELTPYNYGCLAEELTDWTQEIQAKKEARRIRLKSGNDINDLLNAQHVRYTYNYAAPDPWHATELFYGTNRITVDYYIHSLYSFQNNKDFYLVRQVMTIENGVVFWGPESKENYLQNYDDKTWSYSYGAFMSDVTSECSLNANAQLLQVAPLTCQGSTSVSTSVSQSLNGNIGASLSANPGATFGINFGESVSQGESVSIPDLSVVFNKVDQTATWAYNCPHPKNRSKSTGFLGMYESYYHDIAKPISVNTCVVEQNMIWEVDNPKGKYMFTGKTNVIPEVLLSKDGSKNDKYVRIDELNLTKQSIYLDPPTRSYQTDWSMQVLKYGDIDGDMTKTAYFREYLHTNFTNTWLPEMKVYDLSDSDTASARSVFGNFMDALRNRRDEMRATGFTGEFVFALKRGDNIISSYIIDL